MRQIGLVLVLAVAGVGALITPRQQPVPDSPVDLAAPSGAVCSVEQGSGRSSFVAVASATEGPTRLEIFAGGQTAGSTADATTVDGSATFDIDQLAAFGVAGALNEFPGADSAASAVVSGEQSLAGGLCVSSPESQVVVAGGSTRSEERFSLHLMNPYSVDARVGLTVVSEAGMESNDRFESITIPSGDSVVVDLGQIIPGREVITVTVDTFVGDVVAVGRQEGVVDNAMWSGVPAGQDWFIPISASLTDGRVLLVSPVNADVEFQVDLYSNRGFEENYITGSIPARGHVWLDLADVAPGKMAVRVISAAPVVATFVLSNENGVAISNGLSTSARGWLVPAAGSLGGADENLVILNPGINTAVVTVRALGRSLSAVEFDLPADTVAEIGGERADGFEILSTGEIVVLWAAWGERSVLLEGGKPLADG